LLNGKPYDKNFINHFDILKGGKLNFSMSVQPNVKRGISPTSAPYSISK